MKRYLTSVITIFSFFAATAQSVEIENAILNRAIQQKEWLQEEIVAKGKEWAALRKEYPSIPYDSLSKTFYFQRLINFSGVSKPLAFKRAKEWGALNFGRLQSVTDYENAEDGVLIFEGYAEIDYTSTYSGLFGRANRETQTDLYFSIIIRIKDERATVKFENLRFKYRVGGTVIGSVYYPVEYYDLPFGYMFPIVKQNLSKWAGSINLLNASKSAILHTIESIEKYMQQTDKDNKF